MCYRRPQLREAFVHVLIWSLMAISVASDLDACVPAESEWHCGAVRIVTFDAGAELRRSMATPNLNFAMSVDIGKASMVTIMKEKVM